MNQGLSFGSFCALQHPFHLHGHHFWVIGAGIGNYDASTAVFNVADPPLRDTVTVAKGGWAAFRFLANNPGVWFLHCHIWWHQYMGQIVTFVEAANEIGAAPAGLPECPAECTYNTAPWVTRSNFAAALPLVRQALAECQFFALDCEMTGLFAEDRQGAYLDDIQDRYQEMATSASRFVITQFGLSAFAWEGGSYSARTFNFYTFPRPFEGYDRRFVSQASSLEFLASCGFDFNKFIHEGISFMPAAMRDAKLATLERRRERDDILITKQEDVEFVERLVATVTAWLQGGEPVLQLEAGNSYQRAVQYQQLRRDQFGAPAPPGFLVSKVLTDDGRQVLQLVWATPEEAAAHDEQQRQQRIDAINEAAGFTAVFEAMRDSGKPAVGHNLSFDLAYSLYSFADSLPPTWEDYKAMVARWFPGGIWDTKYLASVLPGGIFEESGTGLGAVHDGLLKGGLDDRVQAFFGLTARQQAEQGQGQGLPSFPAEGGGSDASMDNMHSSVADEQGEGASCWELPRVGHAPGFERYEGAETPSYAHEAGYDAYMTGAAFACLLRLHEAAGGGQLAQQGTQQAQHGDAPIGENGGIEAGGAVANGLGTEGDPPYRIDGEGQPAPTAAAVANGAAGHAAAAGVAGGGEQRQLAAVERYKWRMNLTRTDIPYAALQGPDPQPDRSHVLLLTGRLAAAELGQLRVTLVLGGLGALVEIADREAVPRAQQALEQLCQGWRVAPYAEYAALKRAQQDQQQQQQQWGGRPPLRAKRPRVEVQVQQAAIGEQQQEAGPEAEGAPELPIKRRGSSCSMM
ncbi:hypothetical protein N2152v2_000338 [Parachlorella kessleri]